MDQYLTSIVPLSAVSALGLNGTELALLIVIAVAVIATLYVRRPVTQPQIDRMANSRSGMWWVIGIFVVGFAVLAYEFNHWGAAPARLDLSGAPVAAPSAAASHGLSISWGCAQGQHEVVIPTADGLGHHVCALDNSGKAH